MSILGNPLVIGTIGGGKNSIDILKVASESDLPATYTNNAIAVATTEEITSYYFSATQPDTGTEGLLWIISDSRGSNKITLINNQAVELYPAGAKLYHDNAWVSIPSWVFKIADGVWHSCRLYILEDGVFNTELTGSIVNGTTSSNSAHMSSITYEDGRIMFRATSYYDAVLSPSKIFNFTNYSNIVVEHQAVENRNDGRCGVGYNTSATANGANRSVTKIGTFSTYYSQKNVDIVPITPSFDTAYFYFFFTTDGNVVRNIYIYNIYLI